MSTESKYQVQLEARELIGPCSDTTLVSDLNYRLQSMVSSQAHEQKL